MAGAQEKLDMVLAQQRQNAESQARIEAGAAAVEQATAQTRAFVKELGDIRVAIRLQYHNLTDAMKSETLRHSTFQTLLDRMSVAVLSAIAVLAIQYLVTFVRGFL